MTVLSGAESEDALPVDPSLREDLELAWVRSDELFDLLTDAALHARPIALRHPFVFYLGHLPAFAWNQVRAVLDAEPLAPPLDTLFERGIDPLDEEAAAAATVDAWPAREEIVAFRDAVRARLRETWDEVAARADTEPLARGHRIHHVVVEHELMHHETLLYMLERLDPALRRLPPHAPAPETGPAAAQERREIPAGTARLGVEPDAVPFAWGNELSAIDVHVPAFDIDRRPATIGEWRTFVDAGGYDDRALWRDADWRWRQETRVTRPATWVGPRDAPRRRTLLGDLPLESVSGWPVQVSLAEARAYARWRGRRLPTEAELVRAACADGDGVDRGRAHPWGDAAPDAHRANLGFSAWCPTPAGSRPAGCSAQGVDELLGNGWEWTDSTFAPLPGFQAWIRTYPGYSADFFDGRHFVLRGGSWATHPRLCRRSFRNWFQPHYPFVFAKLRTVSQAAH